MKLQIALGCLFLFASQSVYADKGLPGEGSIPPHGKSTHSVVVKFHKALSAGAQKALIDKLLKDTSELSYQPITPPALVAKRNFQNRSASRFGTITFNKNGDAEQAVALLRESNNIELAYLAPRPAPPPVSKKDLSPKTPKYESKQRYIAPAPLGMDIAYIRTLSGGRGEGIKVFDIEGGWNVKHEDLPLGPQSFTNNNAGPIFQQHGTSVAGIIVGIKNSYGVRGIADQATLYLTTPYIGSSDYNLPAAIMEAASLSVAGDVILLEQQFFGPLDSECVCEGDCEHFVPVSYDPATFAAIESATADGRIVVQAAGNGGLSLDSEIFEGLFDPASSNDGSIMVAAVEPGTHEGECFSNRGARIDLNSWGEKVFSTGYGDAFPPRNAEVKIRSPRNQFYTRSFSGTSSASALITGAVTAFQGHAAATGGRLTPQEMLDLLRDTGTDLAPAGFGKMPNLRSAADTLQSARVSPSL